MCNGTCHSARVQHMERFRTDHHSYHDTDRRSRYRYHNVRYPYQPEPPFRTERQDTHAGCFQSELHVGNGQIHQSRTQRHIYRGRSGSFTIYDGIHTAIRLERYMDIRIQCYIRILQCGYRHHIRKQSLPVCIEPDGQFYNKPDGHFGRYRLCCLVGRYQSIKMLPRKEIQMPFGIIPAQQDRSYSYSSIACCRNSRIFHL